MTLTETLGLVQEYYKEKVKPQLDVQNIPKARMHMENLTMEMNEHFKRLFIYHSGANCYARAELIRDQLREGRMPSEDTVMEFEAYLAQLKLSTVSGNRG
jgi:hypothetical protein